MPTWQRIVTIEKRTIVSGSYYLFQIHDPHKLNVDLCSKSKRTSENYEFSKFFCILGSLNIDNSQIVISVRFEIRIKMDSIADVYEMIETGTIKAKSLWTSLIDKYSTPGNSFEINEESDQIVSTNH